MGHTVLTVTKSPISVANRDDVARGRRAPQARTRVVVADYSSISRAGIRSILERSPSTAIVDEAKTYDAVLASVEEHAPDVLIIDLDLGDDTNKGLLVCNTVAERFPNTKILILASSVSELIVIEALRRGALGYMIKSQTTSDELIKAVRAVQEGETAFGKGIGALVSKNFGAPHSVTEQLTERELDVVKLTAQGLGNKQIAHSLFISESTVKFHIHNASIKLHTRKRAELVHRATAAGIIK